MRESASAQGAASEREAPVRSSADAAAELRAAIEARHDLGPEYEPALVASFLDRLDQAIDARIEERTKSRAPAKREGVDGSQLALAIVSIGVGLPLTAVTLVAGGSLVATVIVWVAIVLVNLVTAVRR